MVVVKKKKGESTDKLIMRFKKQIIDSGLIPEVRDRSRFKSKAEKKKERKKQKEHNIKLEKRRNR